MAIDGLDAAFWAGRRVLLTGHTGFKGSWASLWLARMGAEVTGFALAPETEPNLYGLAAVDGVVRRSHIGDLRDAGALRAAIDDADPEIVIHMAAQPLVRRSSATPVETFAANVMGTVNLLEALRGREALRTVLVVTTDKVYENAEQGLSFREEDALGGHDPYSASKRSEEHTSELQSRLGPT